MLVSYVITSIEICVQAVAACATKEQGLRATIRPVLIAALATGLRGMPGVNSDNLDTACLCLVADELIQLSECPTVEAPFRVSFLSFASAHLGGFADIGEVFQDKRTAWEGVLHDALGEDMVTIPVESLSLARQLFQVSLGGLCSFGLQLADETKITTINFLPVPFAQEATGRGDSRSREAQINANDLIRWLDIGFRNRDNDMQPERSMPVEQVGSGNRIACIAGTEMRDGEGKTDLAHAGRQANFLFLPVEGVGMLIVANWTEPTVRTLDGLELWRWLALLLRLGNLLLIGGLMFLLPGEGTLEGLRRFDAGLNEMIGYQARTSGFRLIVRGMMQLHAILFAVLPAISADSIERFGKLPERFLQGVCLLRGGMQLYPYRSVHANLIPYMSYFCKT